MFNQIKIAKPHCLQSLDFNINEILSIAEAGCASAAYMPAVTYCEANEFMSNHGDDVLEYLEDRELLEYIDIKGESWGGIAVKFLSAAIESWCLGVVCRLEDEGVEKDSLWDEEDKITFVSDDDLCYDILSIEWTEEEEEEFNRMASIHKDIMDPMTGMPNVMAEKEEELYTPAKVTIDRPWDGTKVCPNTGLSEDTLNNVIDFTKFKMSDTFR